MISTCPAPDSCHKDSKFEKVLAWISLLTIVALIMGCVTARERIPDKVVPETSGFSMIFYNPTDVEMNYELQWVSHPFDTGRPGPKTMAAGRVVPGDFKIVDYGYPAGFWIVEWRTGNTPNNVQITSQMGLIFDPGDFIVVSTPVHAYCKKGCDLEGIRDERNVYKVFKVGEEK